MKQITDIASVLIAACLLSVSATADEVSFKQDILPQLVDQCGYCHRSADRHGYLVLEDESAYQALVNVSSYQLPSMKRIEPGKPEQSYLWLKGTGEHLDVGGKGWVMPVMMGLRGEFKEQLQLWILQGAKNN